MMVDALAAPCESGGRPRLVGPDGRSVGWTETSRAAHRLSFALAGHAAVVNLCEDRLSFLVVLMAAALAGRTSVIPSDRSLSGLQSIGSLYPNAMAFAEAPEVVRRAGSAGLAAEYYIFDPDDGMPAEPIDPAAFDAAEIVMFTSGSTGRPIPCHRSLSFFRQGAHGNAACMVDGLHGPVGIVATPPPFHMFGFELSVAVPVFEGATVYSGRPFYPADIVAALAAVPTPRILVSTPAHLRILEESDINIPPVARVFSATAPLTAELAGDIEAMTGADLREIFGTTETGSIGWRNTAHEKTFRLLHGFELISQENACRITGPHIWPPVELPDYLRPEGDGRFRIGGRSDDIVNIAGKRMSLSGMNAILTELDGVMDGAFLPPADDATGPVKRTAAVVVAPDLSADEIRSLLRDKLDAAFLPRRIIKVDALPRNETGKLPLGAFRRFALEVIAQSADAERVVRFGADEPFFQGHFPDNPIVPGAVLLAEASEFLADFPACLAGPPEVVTARFPGSAVPGKDCCFRIVAVSGGQIRIECEQAGRIVMKTAMRLPGATDE